MVDVALVTIGGALVAVGALFISVTLTLVVVFRGLGPWSTYSRAATKALTGSVAFGGAGSVMLIVANRRKRKTRATTSA